VLPRLNEDVNEEWISDKTRFALDGLTRKRLDRPYVRREGKLVEASWSDAFKAIAAKFGTLPGDRIAALTGDLVDVESMLALKELMIALGSANLDCRQTAPTRSEEPCGISLQHHDRRHRAGGCLPADRHQPALGGAARQRPPAQAPSRRRFKGRVDRPALDLTFPVTQLGLGPEVLDDLAGANHSWNEVLKAAKKARC